MRESASWFGDVRVSRMARAETTAPQALVMFHGFPGQPPIAEAYKYAGRPKLRIEIAKALLQRREIDAYLPGYEGLGESRGRFSFMRSVERSAALVEDLARTHERVHVLGHSWGAFVACQARRALGERGGRLVLLCGLLDLPDEASVRSFLPPYLKNYPEILGDDAGAFERAVADLDECRRVYNPMSAPLALAPDSLLVVRPRVDAYVDAEASSRYGASAGGRVVVVDDDHVFSGDMPGVAALAADFLAGE